MKNTLKISISLVAIIIVLFVSSCGKKSNPVDPMNSASVSLSYSPTQITKNTPVTFTFTVKDGMNMMVDVTNYTCITKMMMSNKLDTVALSRADTGTYKGTCTFTDSDSVMVMFNCMNGSAMLGKDFMCEVK